MLATKQQAELVAQQSYQKATELKEQLEASKKKQKKKVKRPLCLGVHQIAVFGAVVAYDHSHSLLFLRHLDQTDGSPEA